MMLRKIGSVREAKNGYIVTIPAGDLTGDEEHIADNWGSVLTELTIKALKIPIDEQHDLLEKLKAAVQEYRRP